MPSPTQLPTQTVSPFRARFISLSLQNGGMPAQSALEAITDLRPYPDGALSIATQPAFPLQAFVRPCALGAACERRAGGGCRNLHSNGEGQPACDARPWTAQVAARLECEPTLCLLGAACTEQDFCPRLHRCGYADRAAVRDLPCAHCARHPGIHSPLLVGASREYTSKVRRWYAEQCSPSS